MMIKKKLKIQRITADRFKPFGCLIDYPGRKRASLTNNLFRIVVRQPHSGWRIAYLIVRDKHVVRLEQHPGSLESFEPVCGTSVLFVSTKKNPDDIQAFLLDKSVILKKGLWHGIVASTRESDVKITENSRVRCVYWPLGFQLYA